MLQDKKLLIVGGTGRNVGKTEFICKIIENISVFQDIYALKVSAIFPSEDIYHGTHSIDDQGNELFKETQVNMNKDTSRMLRAGAKEVFYLRSDDSGILTNYEKFRKKVPREAIVICESNSLEQYIQPGLYIIVKSKKGKVKSRAISQLEYADLIVISDGKSGFGEIERISFSAEKAWFIKA